MSKIYRFDLRYEDDQTEVYRLIDIPADYTLEDLHRSILASIEFDQSQLASFYLSDEAWNQGTEFTLMDMGENPEEAETFTMHNASIHEVVGRRQNRLIYLYDYAVMWSFRLELQDILDPDPKLEYPVLVEESGHMPEQTKAQTASDIAELSEEDLEKLSELRDHNHDIIGSDGPDDEEDDYEGGYASNGSYS